MAVKEKSKKRKRNIIVIAVLAVALIIAGGYFLYIKSHPVDPLAAYQTMVAETGNVTQTVSGEGHLRSSGTTSLFISVSQTVLAVYPKAGDTVTAGQLLVEYDIIEDKAELNRRLTEAQLYLQNANLAMQNIARPATGNSLLQYESAVITATKNVEDVKGDIESLENKLYKQRVNVDNLRKIAGISKDDYDDKKIEETDYDTDRVNYRMAQAELDDLVAQMQTKTSALAAYESLLTSAKQKLANAGNPLADDAIAARYTIQKNLADIQQLAIADINESLTKLSEQTLSPIDGNVLSVNVVEGSIASPARGVIELSDPTKAVVVLEINEFDAPMVELAQNAIVTVAGLSDKEFGGKVTKISAVAIEKPNADESEIVVPIEITLDNSDSPLKEGYTVDVEIILKHKEGVITLPISSVLAEDNKYYIYTIAGGVVAKKEIVTGMFGDKTLEVVEGVSKGDIVILNPNELEK